MGVVGKESGSGWKGKWEWLERKVGMMMEKCGFIQERLKKCINVAEGEKGFGPVEIFAISSCFNLTIQSFSSSRNPSFHFTSQSLTVSYHLYLKIAPSKTVECSASIELAVA